MPSIFLCLDAAYYTNETRLYKDVFENYNKYNRPVLKESHAVLVEFDYQLIRIIDVVRRISLRSYCVLINSIGGK